LRDNRAALFDLAYKVVARGVERRIRLLALARFVVTNFVLFTAMPSPRDANAFHVIDGSRPVGLLHVRQFAEIIDIIGQVVAHDILGLIQHRLQRVEFSGYPLHEIGV
jgi:hypothetical protein